MYLRLSIPVAGTPSMYPSGIDVSFHETLLFRYPPNGGFLVSRLVRYATQPYITLGK